MNLTLSVDGAVLEKARERARAMGTSVNQLVRDYLEQLAGNDRVERDMEEWRRLSAEATGDRGGWKFNREEIYDRYDRAEARRRGEPVDDD